jgi:PAS domain S-box-containing protein
MDIAALFNNLITSGITSPSQETINKYRVLNEFLIIIVIAAPLLSLFYYSIGAELLFYVTLCAGLLGVLGLILLRSTKNLILAGNFAFFVVWATLLVIRWNTGAMSEGGIVLLSWIWNAALLLMAIFITGYLWGTIWGSVIFLETGVAVYLFRRGYEFPNLIPADISPIYSLGAYLAGLLIILLIAFLYEREKTSAVEKERVKSRGLVESKRYIDTILERFPFPTFVVDGEHRVIQWNRACQRMTGVPAEKVIGKKVPRVLCVDGQWSLADIIIEDPDSITKRFSESILSTTDSGFFELGIPLPSIKEGIEAVVTVAPIYDVNGSVKGAIETIQDVGNRQGETHRGYESHEGNLETELCPIFRLNSKGKISFWNKACEKAFGYPSSKLIGASPFQFVSKSTQEPFKETILRVFKGESFSGMEWKYYSASRGPVNVLANAYPLLSTDGKPRECVIMNTDITELAARMQQMEKDSVEAKEKLKSLADEYALLRKNLATYIRKKDGN